MFLSRRSHIQYLWVPSSLPSSCSSKPNVSRTRYSCKSPTDPNWNPNMGFDLYERSNMGCFFLDNSAQGCLVWEPLWVWNSRATQRDKGYLHCLCQMIIRITMLLSGLEHKGCHPHDMIYPAACARICILCRPKQPVTGPSTESPHLVLILHSNHPCVHLIKCYFGEIRTELLCWDNRLSPKTKEVK